MQTRSPLIGALSWKRAADAIPMTIGRRHRVGSAPRQRLIGDGQQLFTLDVDEVPDAEDGTAGPKHAFESVTTAYVFSIITVSAVFLVVVVMRHLLILPGMPVDWA
jgi:hypothetical protein